MKKFIQIKRFVICTIFLFLILFIGYSNMNIESTSALVKRPGPETIEQLTAISEVIVEVFLTGKEELYPLDGPNRQKSRKIDAEILKIIRGSVCLEDSIITFDTWYQLDYWSNPEQRHFLLFLEHGEDREGEEPFYRIVGVTTGSLYIGEDGLLFRNNYPPQDPRSKKHYMDEEFTGLTVEEAIEKINAISSLSKVR